METVKSDYDGRLSQPEGRSSDGFCQEDVFHSFAAKVRTILEQDNDGTSEKALSYMIEFENILLQVAKVRKPTKCIAAA